LFALLPLLKKTICTVGSKLLVQSVFNLTVTVHVCVKMGIIVVGSLAPMRAKFIVVKKEYIL
jgi:uncharacterized protein (DUF983 family)